MSVSYYMIFRQALNLLGAVAGATAATADANYLTGPPTTSTVVGPDFTPSQVQDACCNALAEIVRAICETPRHPERPLFMAATGNLANEASLPAVDSGGSNPIIGAYGSVYDASNGSPCAPAPLDKIRDFTLYSGSGDMYNGLDIYWYAIAGGKIYHTRTNVVIDVCTYTRPTSFSGNIPVRDIHERGLVCGTASILAPKEGMYSLIRQACQSEFEQHLAAIRSLTSPVLSNTEIAPSAT